MKTELSAGGVVVTIKFNLWHVLIIKDRKGNWTFPKGLIETGETPFVAAKREVKEEVGLTNLRVVKALTPVQYIFTRGGLVKKTVYYFLFIYEGDTLPVGQKEEGISDAQWTKLSDALAFIGYPKTNNQLLNETRTYLQHTKSR